MMRVIRSELTRLGSPWLLLGGIGLMTLFGILATVVVFVTAGSGSATLPGTQNITVAMLEAPDGMFAGLQTFAGMLGIVALVVWAMSATTDVSSGLIRLLVQAEPRRLLLLGGKIVALVVFTCAATLVATVMVMPMAPGPRQVGRSLHGRLAAPPGPHDDQRLLPPHTVRPALGRGRTVRRGS